MERIVVGVVDTPAARMALRWAYRAACKEHAELHVVTAYGLPLVASVGFDGAPVPLPIWPRSSRELTRRRTGCCATSSAMSRGRAGHASRRPRRRCAGPHWPERGSEDAGCRTARPSVPASRSFDESGLRERGAMSCGAGAPRDERAPRRAQAAILEPPGETGVVRGSLLLDEPHGCRLEPDRWRIAGSRGVHAASRAAQVAAPTMPSGVSPDAA